MQRSSFLLSKIGSSRLGRPITDVKDTGKVVVPSHKNDYITGQAVSLFTVVMNRGVRPI